MNVDKDLKSILKEHVFIGMLDDTLVLIQHKTKLYSIDLAILTYELFYRKLLKNFKNHKEIIQIDSEPKISEMIFLGLNLFKHSYSNDELNEVCKLNTESLIKNRHYLKNWFNIKISDDGKLLQIPKLLNGYMPNSDNLIELVLRLVNDIDEYEESVKCAISIAKVIARFYAINDNKLKKNQKTNEDFEEKKYQWIVENIILKELRYGSGPKKIHANDGSIIEIIGQDELYKIFERC